MKIVLYRNKLKNQSQISLRKNEIRFSSKIRFLDKNLKGKTMISLYLRNTVEYDPSVIVIAAFIFTTVVMIAFLCVFVLLVAMQLNNSSSGKVIDVVFELIKKTKNGSWCLLLKKLINILINKI